MHLELHVTGPDGQKVVPIGDAPISIGRALENEIPLVEDNALSRQHCVIERRGPVVYVRDLDSRHGTWIRGKKLQVHEVALGDAVFVGRTRLLFLPPNSKTPPMRPIGPPPPPGPQRPAAPERQAPPPPPPQEQAPVVAASPRPQYPPFSLEGLDKIEGFDESFYHTEGVRKVGAASLSLPKGWPGGVAPDSPSNPIQQLLREARKQGASDIHFTPQVPICLRINGALHRIAEPISASQINRILHVLLTQDQRDYFKATGDYDFCYSFPSGGRFRTNCANQRTGNHVTLRVIKEEIRPLEDLGIPTATARLTEYAQGLVLVTGPMGAGKTTSMMSLVKLVNENRPDHIITVEDPIEFLLPSAQCQVSQRQLGIHTDSFDAALRAALREDPDIIVIGDMRDYQTTALAISASETGHLVFASMHAMNCAKTLDKLVDMFPAGEQSVIRMTVSESLRGILCQRLVPDLQGGRVPACELLFNSIAVANIIRENKTSNLINAMQLGQSQGMLTLDMSLQSLLDAGRIDAPTAFAYCENKDRFRKLLPKDAQELLKDG